MRPAGMVLLSLSLVVPLLAACSFEGESPNRALNSLPDGSDGCTVVDVVASSEKAALLAGVADEYNSLTSGENCKRVLVYSKASGGAMSALAAGWDETTDGPRPDVWSPASTSWLRLLSQRASDQDQASPAPLDAPSVAQTPLVIAMPRPMAVSLGWPETPLGWSDILSLSQDPAGWGSQGHPEWGPFKLGKTNPNFSTSGLNATVGTYFAATGLSSDLSAGDVSKAETEEYVSKIEESVVHYGDTTLTFLSNMDKASREGRGLTYVSAVTLEEKSVLDYNSGNPTGDPKLAGKGEVPSVPLVAIYPKEGTLVSDNPFAVLEGVPAPVRGAAEEFLKMVRSPEVQGQLQAAGFRNFEGTPGDVLSARNGFVPADPMTISPPAPLVLDAVLESWATTRKGARVLLVVDVSGSMESGGKLDLAKEAILSSMDQFSDHDQVGLATFSDEYDMVVPVSSFSSSRGALEDAVRSLSPQGGTALYSAAAQGVRDVDSLPAGSTIDAVVVLSDGENTEPGSLEAVLDAQGGKEDPVRLFTIGYGSGADMDVLREMSDASGAVTYDASDAADIDTVMQGVISNF